MKLESVSWPEVLPDHAGVAAVLVPVCQSPETGRETILLIKRSGEPGYHSRQIAFPGGFKEPEDADTLQTALRESEEEIGLKANDVQILGTLPLEMTARKILIFPWVGRFSLPYDFRLNPKEVERILYLPVEQLVKDGVPPIQSPGPFRGESIGLHVDGELVWGATARILKQFLQHSQHP